MTCSRAAERVGRVYAGRGEEADACRCVGVKGGLEHSI